ncbi:MAG TPA: stage V sporulation protein AC [Candidatus Faecimorpha stercoravium]|jgi:stage V sporulation protein AC|nr:stage V sporulation protein AC [Candidatus Faecimorpha stercoravium]
MNMTEQGKQDYKLRVSEVCPQTNLLSGCAKAFLVGGSICVLGQGLLNFYQNMGLDMQTASTWVSVTLIFFSAITTGLGWYDNLGKFAGAGSIIPITGFANGVVASAIEFKKEGFILGLGSKLFTIAGPVILYGLITSSLVGVIYYLVTMLGG